MRKIFDELKQQGDPRMLGNGRIFDEYRYGNAAMRDYYNRVMGGEKSTTDKAEE